MPSLREKKRYIGFEVISEKAIDFQRTADAIWSAALQFVGVKGAAAAGIVPVVERWDEKRQRGVVRVAHTSVDDVKASFLFINNVEGSPVVVRSTRVSGAVAKAIQGGVRW